MSLREIVWDRSQRDRPRLDQGSLERFKEAATRLVATFSAKQHPVIQMLANIVGLQFNC